MRNQNIIKLSFLSLLCCTVVASCSDKEELPEANRSDLNFDNATYNYGLTPEPMATLGRVLFYDKALSINDAVACASCHKQSMAFADDKRFSDGFDNEKTTRNTPPIQNLSSSGFLILNGETGDFDVINGEFGQALFWDGRTRVLEQMVLEPVSNHIEMGMRSPSDLKDRLNQRSYYDELFKNAFGDAEITVPRIGVALAGFIRSFQSNSSPFHQEMFGFGQTVLTPLQREGFNLFVDKYDCMSCHDISSDHGYSEPIGNEFSNIGLDNEYTDQGVGALTGNSADNGKFRIPNLRNIALTAPYMHDGRFATLDEVIGHYNNSIQSHPNLDSRLKEITGEARIMNITPDEQVALVAFLHSLSDQNFIRDPKFSDPFK